MTPRLSFLLACAALFAVTGCAQMISLSAVTAGMAIGTKPGYFKNGNQTEEEAQKEVWCYGTLGAIDCYATPQRGQASRLIMVDPPSRYPQDVESYNKMVGEYETAKAEAGKKP